MSLVLQEQGGQKISSQAAATELDSLMEFLDSQSDLDKSSFEQLMQGPAGHWRGFAEIEFGNYEENNPDNVFDGKLEGFIASGIRWRKMGQSN